MSLTHRENIKGLILHPQLTPSPPYCESVEFVAMESIYELELTYIGGDEDLLAVATELDAGPLDVAIVLPHVEGGKGALRNEPQ